MDSTGASQCIEGISETSYYGLKAEVLIPSGQSTTGLAHLVVVWYASPACSDLLDVEISSSVSSSITDTWTLVSSELLSPMRSQSAKVRLDILKSEDGGNLSAHFDNVAFAEGIFRDTFETGTTSAWSATVGLHEPGPVSFISLQATPGTVPREGGRLELLALVKDDAGWGVPNAPVSFLTEVGTLDSGGALLKTGWSGQVTDSLTLSAGDIDALGTSTFTVSAQTVDFTGAQIEAIFRVNVQTGAPIAEFSWVANRLEVIFQNLSTGLPPLSYLWRFGDGTTSTAESPIKVYPVPGNYTVSLTVSNSVGADTIAHTVTVTQ